jgi:hypothetical protein
MKEIRTDTTDADTLFDNNVTDVGHGRRNHIAAVANSFFAEPPAPHGLKELLDVWMLSMFGAYSMKDADMSR